MSTVTISASDVNKLRQMTGAGMMDCKKALMEANGDFEKAIDELRKKGQKVAANRADREAKEGYIVAKTNNDATKGYLVALSCETDFVAKNAEFVKFAEDVLETALTNNAANLDALLALQLQGTTI
ncbi:MAG: translation elongation factor Ts, partial [Bacteroidia bacterium]|nr:translation elongation factor Ts [Bacteroidia bacterium]HND72777.1 translation elongation factor Ts [Bacteroidia bacterium]